MGDVEVGSIAPTLALCDDEDPEARCRRPRLLAFVRAWSTDNEPAAELAHVRRRLARLGIELVIVCEQGAWSFVRDRAPAFCDRLAAEVTAAAAAYGVHGDAVFVIDHRGVIRFACRPDRPLGEMLTRALDAAAAALRDRRHGKLQRVQCSPREWALECLIGGCASTFADIPEPERFARGSGPIRVIESGPAITPSANAVAPESLHEASSRRPTCAALAQNAQEALA